MFKIIYKTLHIKQLKGKDRIYQFLKNRNLPYTFRFKTSTDISLDIDPGNYIDKHILQHGGYETEVLEELFREATERTVFWDIGANIGFHSLSFKKRYPLCEVYSFEPDYKNFASIINNKNINNLNVNLLNFALSDKNATAELYTISGNNGMSTLAPWPKFNWNKNTFSIACFYGDYLIDNGFLQAPTIIKLDVEGHELQVLKGLSKTLLKGNVKKIILEQPNNFLDAESEIKTILKSSGYTLSKLERNEPTDHQLSNFLAYLY